MLKIEQLAVAYGAIDALHGISLVVAEGPPDEVARNRDVITAYLGGTLDAA